MALDSFVIGGLAEELNARLENARVDKVTMPRRDRVILHLRSRDEGNVRLLLCAGAGARVHLTREKFDNPETPPMLCMLLRKQMAGGSCPSPSPSTSGCWTSASPRWTSWASWRKSTSSVR